MVVVVVVVAAAATSMGDAARRIEAHRVLLACESIHVGHVESREQVAAM